MESHMCSFGKLLHKEILFSFTQGNEWGERGREECIY
jgi:hypothetical protein